jgi:hypothetical protein
MYRFMFADPCIRVKLCDVFPLKDRAIVLQCQLFSELYELLFSVFFLIACHHV